jgi:starch phosphorylase
MAREAGEENFFLFGLTAEQVANSRGWYNPHWHYEHEPETKQALGMIATDYFSRDEPGIFRPIVDTLLTRGDFYMHLADLRAYLETQSHVDAVYNTQDIWTRMAIANVACSGTFSSDRAITQYASGIWNMQPYPIA